jgi:tRNA1Val (adenine37-N6)-methyltransferase
MKVKGFTFRQFHVRQNGAAMKVTTDACVFAAWIPGPIKGNILDAGTGTGLLALMLAQRFPELRITGIELDEAAFEDARHNFIHSPFADRLHAIHADVLAYSNPVPFDAIVCNPPFFVNALPAQNITRNLARHISTAFSVDCFLETVTKLLRDEGSLFLLLPPAEAEHWMEAAAVRKLFPVEICKLKHDPLKAVHRWMISLQRLNETIPPPCAETQLNLTENGEYSAPMRAMLRPFYLYVD